MVDNTERVTTSLEIYAFFSAVMPRFVYGYLLGVNKCVLYVKCCHLLPLSVFLFRNLLLGAHCLLDLTAVDRFFYANRFMLLYCFVNLSTGFRIFVKVFVPEHGFVPSLSNIIASSNWLEREVWDMFGVPFSSHSDMRRILTDYGFSGHPLRKDFPLTGFIELRYDDSLKRVVYEPLELTQEFRVFNFVNP